MKPPCFPPRITKYWWRGKTSENENKMPLHGGLSRQCAVLTSAAIVENKRRPRKQRVKHASWPRRILDNNLLTVPGSRSLAWPFMHSCTHTHVWVSTNGPQLWTQTIDLVNHSVLSGPHFHPTMTINSLSALWEVSEFWARCHFIVRQILMCAKKNKHHRNQWKMDHCGILLWKRDQTDRMTHYSGSFWFLVLN